MKQTWNSPRAPRRVYYGWWIVAASFVGLSGGQTPVAFISFGVFIKPLTAQFGWGRGDVSFALSICALAITVVTPFVGRLIDRHGVRRVLLPSMAGFGLLVASLYFQTASLLQFYLIYLLIGIIGAGANNISYMRVITAWFSRNRGIALGLASSAAAITLVMFLAQFLISTFSWRVAYLGIGAVMLLVCLPIVALVIREHPPDTGPGSNAAADGARSELADATSGLAAREAIATPIFWVMILLAFLIAVSLHGLQIHIIPLLTDRGMSSHAAVNTWLLAGGASTIAARVGTGWLFDRFFAPRVAMIAFLLSALGMVALIGTHSISLWVVCTAAALAGVGGGTESGVLGYLTGRYFGLRAFGQIYGYVFASFMLGTAIGPYLFGLIFDMNGSYTVPLSISLAFLLSMCVLLGFMPPYPKFRDETATTEPNSLTDDGQYDAAPARPL